MMKVSRGLVLLSAIFLALSPIVAPAAPEEGEAENAPLFYPPPPNLPRLQYLTKFTSVYDVSGSKGGFRDFVFGGEDAEQHSVEKPYGVAVYDGAVFVIDSRLPGYVVFDFANGKWRQVQGSGNGAMSKPINITIDEDGTRYVTDTARDLILVYDRADRYVRSIGSKDQFRPIDVAIAGDRLYVTDIENQQIHILDKQSGETISIFGEGGTEPGMFAHPMNLAIAPDGSIYVTDTTNFRVQQFSKDGEFIREIGSIGTGIGMFGRPKGVAVDREGRIYVSDAAFENVQVFDDQGRVLMFFGGPGLDRGNLNLPTVVKIDYDNVDFFRKYADPDFEIEYLVFVPSQYGNNKVTVFGFGSLKE